MSSSSKSLEISHKNNRYESRFELGLIDKSIEILKDNLNGLNVLEFGCGLGATTKFLSQNANSVTSVEYSTYFIKVVKQMDLSNVEIIQCKWEEFTSEEEFTDIVLFRALDCVNDIDVILDVIECLSSRNTIIHIVITNTNSIHRILGQRLNKDKVNSLTERAHEVGRLQSLDYNTMRKHLLDHKFEILEFHGIGLKMFPNEEMDNYSESRIKALLDMGDVVDKKAVELYFKVKCK